MHTHLAALDEAAKPHRRIWRSGRGVYVKTHARLGSAHRLGNLHWVITGSVCDDAGAALPLAGGVEGVAILPNADGGAPRSHHFYAAAQDGLSPADRAAALRTDFEAALQRVVTDVEAAWLAFQDAAALAAAPSPLPQS